MARVLSNIMYRITRGQTGSDRAKKGGRKKKNPVINGIAQISSGLRTIYTLPLAPEADHRETLLGIRDAQSLKKSERPTRSRGRPASQGSRERSYYAEAWHRS